MLLVYLFPHIVPHAEDAVNSVQEVTLKCQIRKHEVQSSLRNIMQSTGIDLYATHKQGGM
jgi:hypothetical protein